MSTDLFLTPAELATLTGVRRPSAQIRWLRSRQVRHFVNAVGHPVICRVWLTGEQKEAIPMPQRPNLRVLKGAA